MTFEDESSADESQGYDDDHIYAWNNYQEQQEPEQQQTETPPNNIDDVDEDWIIVNDISSEDFDIVNIEGYEEKKQ